MVNNCRKYRKEDEESREKSRGFLFFMPNELLEIYRRRIHARMIKKIKAYVSVGIKGYDLEIFIRWHDINYRYYVGIDELTTLVLNGVRSDVIADKVIYEFKKAIMDEIVK